VPDRIVRESIPSDVVIRRQLVELATHELLMHDLFVPRSSSNGAVKFPV
jgi:hypothetical protein